MRPLQHVTTKASENLDSQSSLQAPEHPVHSSRLAAHMLRTRPQTGRLHLSLIWPQSVTVTISPITIRMDI